MYIAHHFTAGSRERLVELQQKIGVRPFILLGVLLFLLLSLLSPETPITHRRKYIWLAYVPWVLDYLLESVPLTPSLLRPQLSTAFIL